MNQLEQVRWRVTTDGRLLAAAAGDRVTAAGDRVAAAGGRVTSSRQGRTVVTSSSRQVDLSESLVVCISQL